MKRLGAAWLLVLGAAAPRVRAQGTNASFSVDAVVITPGMTITTLRNLDFGSVVKGVATTIAPNGPNAGEWQVQASSNAFIGISFTLPTVLTNIQALPGSTMPITFSATSALWRRQTNNPAGATAFDPAVGATGRVGPPPNPFLYIWIGGTVNPALTAKPGIYTANIIVSLIYT